MPNILTPERTVGDSKIEHDRAWPRHDSTGKRRKTSVSTDLKIDEMNTRQDHDRDQADAQPPPIPPRRPAVSNDELGGPRMLEVDPQAVISVAVPQISSRLDTGHAATSRPIALSEAQQAIYDARKKPERRTEAAPHSLPESSAAPVRQRQAEEHTATGKRKVECDTSAKVAKQKVTHNQKPVFTLKKLHQKIQRIKEIQNEDLAKRIAAWTPAQPIYPSRKKAALPAPVSSVNIQSRPPPQAASAYKAPTAPMQTMSPQMLGVPSVARASQVLQDVLQEPAAINTGTGFTPPKVPSVGIYNMMNNYDTRDIKQYLHYLLTLSAAKGKLGPKDMQYTQLQPEPYLREMNGWLLSLLPPYENKYMFRSIPMPKEMDHTLLARCIRYAHSHAQQQLSWAVHPVHVALIAERTNEYGIALATPSVEKSSVRVDADDLRRRFGRLSDR